MRFNSLFFALLLLAPHMVSASFLQLTPAISPPDIIANETVDLPLIMVNNGDETAYNIQISLLLPDGFTANNIFYRTLDSQDKRTDKFTLQVQNGTLPGTYVFCLSTHYADANQYGFSSVNSVLVNYKTSTISKINGFISNTELDNQPEKITVSVYNNDEISHDVKLKFFLPDELMVNNKSYGLNLAPNEEKKIDMMVSSTRGLPGSTYSILATAMYAEDGRQYSSILRGVVTVKKMTNPMPLPIWVPLIVIFLIVAAIIYWKYKNMPAKRGRKPK